MDTPIRPERFPSKEYKDFRTWRQHFTRVATANGWDIQQQIRMIPCSLGSGPLEEYATLPENQREGDDVTGASPIRFLYSHNRNDCDVRCHERPSPQRQRYFSQTLAGTNMESMLMPSWKQEYIWCSFIR